MDQLASEVLAGMFFIFITFFPHVSGFYAKLNPLLPVVLIVKKTEILIFFFYELYLWVLEILIL